MLNQLAIQATWLGPADILTSLVQSQRVLEVAAHSPDVRDVWRRIRYVTDQARAWSDAGGSGLRRYLEWVSRHGQDGRMVADVVLPESDQDSIRIMTIHAAKGLEFPITIVSGLTAAPASTRGVRAYFPPNGQWALKTKLTADPIYQEFQPIDEQMTAAERIRLLYVACTRARDHLVVSGHRVDRDRQIKTNAEVLAAACADLPNAPDIANPSDHALVRATYTSAWQSVEEWRPQHQATVRRASAIAAISATTLAQRAATELTPVFRKPEPTTKHRDDNIVDEGITIDSLTNHADNDIVDEGLAKEGVDVDLPAWQRGRYGTAVGRAVHAVLQSADFTNEPSLAAMSKVQAGAEEVATAAREVAALAQSALDSPVVRLAATSEHWRELFVSTTVAGVVLEGYIDLLVRDPQRGLIIVDYKTDHIAKDEAWDKRLGRYRLQLAAYALALQQITGEQVAAGVLVICSATEPAHEMLVPDWQQAIDQARIWLTDHS